MTTVGTRIPRTNPNPLQQNWSGEACQGDARAVPVEDAGREVALAARARRRYFQRLTHTAAILMAGELTVLRVSGAAILAEVRTAQGNTYRLGTHRGRPWCSCPQDGVCGHLRALALVTHLTLEVTP